MQSATLISSPLVFNRDAGWSVRLDDPRVTCPVSSEERERERSFEVVALEAQSPSSSYRLLELRALAHGTGVLTDLEVVEQGSN